MKRWMTAFLVFCFLASPTIVEAAEQDEELPPIAAVAIESVERSINDNEAFVYKEYLQTANETVNQELRMLVDTYDEQLSGLLKADPKKKGKLNSRLNVDIIYYRTGEHWISTMIQADIIWYRQSQTPEITTRTYDLETGRRVTLTDLFAEDSAAWDLLAQGVKSHMLSIYPGEERDVASIEALCAREALATADFTLSGMELTLHYSPDTVFSGKNALIHVRFYYPQFEGMMTPAGVAITDNSRWKMVAITCDDGPKDYTSTYALNAFRKAGARVTYFVVGKQLTRYGDVFQRQFNQNHSIASHSYNHWSGYSFKTVKGRLAELTKSDELALALVGEPFPFFRAPGGTYPPWMEVKLSVPIIQWSLDTYDYTGKNAKKIAHSISSKVKEYDIILCHDTGKHLHEAIPLFSEYLTSQGYMMVTLEELLAAQGVTAMPNSLYWSFRPGEHWDELPTHKKK